MSGFELYVFFLCLIVFTELTLLFSVMLYYILNQTHQLIKHGLKDERIKIEYDKEMAVRPWVKRLGNVLTAVLLVIIFSVFALSVSIQLADDRVQGDMAVPKVVMSASMSRKNAANDYLETYDLNDQFDTFDIILTRELPGEYELELYDIVVYEYEDALIIHRIIGIEEPNEAHPDCRHFLLRGDASRYSDEYPVLYEQMCAIYRGERIPYVGSFFAFMRSPAGYLCILLVLFAVVATPIAEKKLWRAKVERLTEIGYIPSDRPDIPQEPEQLISPPDDSTAPPPPEGDDEV